MTIFWFRRDLRLHDNKGLYAALKNHDDVLPIFIFDEDILSKLPKNDHRVQFIHHQLSEINKTLLSHQKSLVVFYGKPQEVLKDIIKNNQITAVYTNEDYEPYARKRDLDIYHILQEHQIPLKTSKDQVIFEKSDITKDDGTPYVVYTPYSKKWLSTLTPEDLESYPSENLLHNITAHNYPFLTLEDFGFQPNTMPLPNYNTSDKVISEYEQNRNFPANNKGTSYVGIYLRFGVLSIRDLVKNAMTFQNNTYLKELIWREFFMQILWHFPHTFSKSFKPAYDNITWENNETDFEFWCLGKTGYPFVDAGMRELNQTGHMHNRVRMIVASFLCKHLLIDWRWGEAYFAQKLFDYEMASNVGNWQWAAGSGVDAAPYFRIFNPTEQIKKFDKDLQYIKRWIPEFGTSAYPEPIVEHKFARERCLARYKAAV